jgi:hypothetical protein
VHDGTIVDQRSHFSHAAKTRLDGAFSLRPDGWKQPLKLSVRNPLGQRQPMGNSGTRMPT